MTDLLLYRQVDPLPATMLIFLLVICIPSLLVNLYKSFYQEIEEPEEITAIEFKKLYPDKTAKPERTAGRELFERLKRAGDIPKDQTYDQWNKTRLETNHELEIKKIK